MFAGPQHLGSPAFADLANPSRPHPCNFFMQRYTDSFAAEIQAFTEAVLEDKPIQVTGADSRMPVVMALAAGKSSEERRPVRISEVSA
jgi:myo-inositol 2-dehydrogenase/D-chiro-inositol 1-dehydrogenase